MHQNYFLSIEWNSIRLGGPAHEKVTINCTVKVGCEVYGFSSM